eukprot:CAMPEP_0174260340 /NCGR_PEP_ID=MMETSP0439-20130205/9651_1 /TAXON_ID=0 /ORGANISM="Stereomyxa ramosa, Strain Chinc5" /LENGTH=185 /DNA_ID=CAMNT_0015344563 /DNA_START=56 /DNA_END=614 /DNA_ORIENTATION=-
MSLYKITVLGQGAVGKTAITIRLCSNHFVEYYDPTIENSYRRQVVIDGEVAVLDVLDTAGQDEYSALRAQWIRSGEGFVIMYSITAHRTFEFVEMFRNLILESKDLPPEELPPTVLIGNKCDLEDEREVSTVEGEDLAKKCGTLFFETSAKDHINVEESFFALVDSYGRDAPPTPPQSPKRKTKS